MTIFLGLDNVLSWGQLATWAHVDGWWQMPLATNLLLGISHHSDGIKHNVIGNVVHAVHMLCKVSCIDHHLKLSFGLFLQATGFLGWKASLILLMTSI